MLKAKKEKHFFLVRPKADPPPGDILSMYHIWQMATPYLAVRLLLSFLSGTTDIEDLQEALTCPYCIGRSDKDGKSDGGDYVDRTLPICATDFPRSLIDASQVIVSRRGGSFLA